MADGLTISINNLTTKTWTRNNWHVGAGQNEGVNWCDQVSQSPVPELQPHTFTQVVAEQVWMTQIVRDALWVILGYGNGPDNFAISLACQFHMLGMGKGIVWSVWDNGWHDLGQDATPYQWIFKDFKVVATPTLENTGACVEVNILSAPKK